MAPSPSTATTSAGGRHRLGDLWHELPRDGRLLISTVAVETLGTGLVLSFGLIYLHEVRGLPLELTGSLLAVPAVVGMLVVGPVGSVTDRFGARRVVLAGMLAQFPATSCWRSPTPLRGQGPHTCCSVWRSGSSGRRSTR